MKAKRTILAIVAMLLASTAWGVTTNYRQHWGPDVVYHPCIQGKISLCGTDHILYKSMSDGDGGWRVTVHNNGHVAGEILTGPYAGAKLTGSSCYNHNYNSMKPGVVYTEIGTVQWNGQGQTPNLKVKMVYHYTVNANGVLTSDVQRDKELCK